MRAAIVLALAGCSHHATATVVDAARDAPPGPRCDPASPFGAPTLLDSLETDLDEVTARLTPDELFIAFCRRNPDLTYDLYSATRDTVADPFGAAQVMGTVNSIYSELWPTLSPDGLTMWFDSDRITPGTYLVWTTRRASITAPFDPPTPQSDFEQGDGSQYLTASGEVVYFSSNVRPGLGMNDLFRADVGGDGSVSAAVAVAGGVNSAEDEVGPAVTADELTIFFRRATGSESDVYTASRSSIGDAFGAATPVDGLSVPGVYEVPTWVSPDGCHLYYYSTTPGDPAGSQLYMVARPM